MLRSASKRAADDPHAPSVPPLKRRSVHIDPKLRAEWRSAEQGQQLLLQQQRQAATSPSSSAHYSAAVDVCGLTADDWCGQGTGKKASQCPPKSATTTGLSWGRGRARFNLNSHSNISRHSNIAGEKNLFLPHSKISFLPTSASPVFPSPPPPPPSRQQREASSPARPSTSLLRIFPSKPASLSSCQVLRPRAQRPLLRQRSQLPLDRRQVSHDIHARRDRRHRGKNRVVPGGGLGSRRRRRRRRRWAAAAAAAEIPTAHRPGSAHPLRGLRSLPDSGPQRLRDRGAGLARRVGEQVVLRRGARNAAAGLALALALALAGCELLGLPQLVRQRRKRRLSLRRDRREADGPTRVRGGPAGVRAGRGDWGAAEDGQRQRGEASEDGVPSDLVRKEKLGEKERNKNI